MTKILITSMGGAGSNNLVDSIRLLDNADEFEIVGTHFDPAILAMSDLDDLYVVPKAKETEAYIDAHVEIIDKLGVDLLIANSDAEVAAFSHDLGRLRCKHLIPDMGMVSSVQDKYVLNQILRKHGNPTVTNVPVTSREQLPGAVAELGCEKFWMRLRNGAGSLGATWMYTADQAAKWLDLWCELRGFTPEDFVLAPFLPGRDFCVAVMFDRGEFMIGKIYERLSYLLGGVSISGMGSTPGYSVTVDEREPIDVCVGAVRAIYDEYGGEPHGFYQLDMKCDEAGQAYVTEINIGRFPMTSPQFDRVGKHSMIGLYMDMILHPEKELPRGMYDLDPGVMILRSVDCPVTFLTREDVDKLAARKV